MSRWANFCLPHAFGSDAFLERHCTFGVPTPHNIMPALTANARPMAIRKGTAVLRCGKAYRMWLRN